MRSKKLFTKMIRVVVVSLLFFLAVLQLFYFRLSSDTYNRFVQEQGKALVNEVRALVKLQFTTLEFIEQKNQVRMQDLLNKLVEENFSSTYLIALADLELILRQQAMNPELEDIYIINRGGSVINTTREPAQGFNFNTYSSQYRTLIQESFKKKSPTGGKLGIEPHSRRIRQFMFIPTEDGEYLIGVGFYVPDADFLFEYIKQQISEIPSRYEKVISIDLIFAASEPFSINSDIRLSLSDKERIGEAVNNKFQFYEFSAENDFVEVYSYLSIPHTSPDSEMVLRSIQDRSEEIQNLYAIPFQTSLLALPLAILVMLIILIAVRNWVVAPLKQIDLSLKILALGNLDASNKILVRGEDEIARITSSVNTISDKMYQAKEYIASVEKGNWSQKFKASDADDELGQALVKMRNSLQYLEDEQLQRQIEDEKQNWVTRGLAQFSELIYKNADDTTQLAEVIIKNLVRYLHAVQGGFFIIVDEDKEDLHLDLIAAYAYDRRKFMEKRVGMQEGFVGMCALEKQTIYKTDIPKNYFAITSGLGKGAPTAILLVPLKVADKVFGVIEVATFESFNQFQIEFAEKIADSLGASLANLKARWQTNQALEQMQEQTASFEEEKQNYIEIIDKLEDKLGED